MARYVRVIMAEEKATPQGSAFWEPIKETLAEAPTVSEAVSRCDERFDAWLEARLNGEPSEAFLKGRRFQVVQAAPWDVRD